ncbi:hypothetical protein ACSQ76_05820 [Roseovarius sp. B08]|uniref:hypothetical protein n=1 Tax=Roseovarius sp. B08 TaxID=3449223 RepID=UPI003EDBFC9E
MRPATYIARTEDQHHLCKDPESIRWRSHRNRDSEYRQQHTFLQLGRPILFENDLQSVKVIAVLFEMEPLPLMFTNGLLYLAIAAGIGGIHGLIFHWVEPVLPPGVVKRGSAFGVILWALMALYFEFHPFQHVR